MARFLWIYILAALAAVWLANSALKLQGSRPALNQAASNQAFSGTHGSAARAAVAKPQAFGLPTEYVESRHGSYMTPVQLEGREVRMIIDTGASLVSLTKEDAELIGIRPAAAAFTIKLQTANGISSAAPAWLPSVRVGSVEVHDVQALVMAPGASSVSLLGMSFLQRLHRFGVADGRMLLEQ